MVFHPPKLINACTDMCTCDCIHLRTTRAVNEFNNFLSQQSKDTKNIGRK